MTKQAKRKKIKLYAFICKECLSNAQASKKDKTICWACEDKAQESFVKLLKNIVDLG